MKVNAKRVEVAKRMAIRQRNYRRVRDRALTSVFHKPTPKHTRNC
jgi:hypothetical protein